MHIWPFEINVSYKLLNVGQVIYLHLETTTIFYEETLPKQRYVAVYFTRELSLKD